MAKNLYLNTERNRTVQYGGGNNNNMTRSFSGRAGFLRLERITQFFFCRIHI